ncbi:MAG TPA: heparan-alpha-glucosaminide N-acetyltransferase domain-containing protein [Gemmatimonadales bacterium]|nr:heparan-alpha-glucosaminide N-acetyltransferase domain-containing protein [Gemmatimonadales bacterium]
MRPDAGQPVGAVTEGAARTLHAATTPARVASIDVIRGAVMVLMALDHVRDYVTNIRVQPENLAQASAALFATRWVTHFCAPAFALLAGVGIGLAMHRGKPAGEISRFLVVRGIWLVILDLVITAAGWQFGFRLIPAFALVLWALGLSMLLMAALIHLPRSVVAAGSLLMIATHNVLDSVRPDAWGALAPLWHVLHVPGFAIPGKLFIAYPLIPWAAVMALGWVLADVYRWEAGKRRAFLIRVGVAATVLFIVVRAINTYGDPVAWSEQRSAALTVASFLNTRKYPPSLDFLLMTLGPALVALALVEGARHRVARWLSVYGQVPLFYYVVHICLAHVLAIALALVQGGELRRIPVVHDPGSIPEWHGVPLPGVYVAWLLVVVAMYPLCRWFARLKRARRAWWLSYL